MIATQSLFLKRGHVTVLQDISVTIPKRGITAIIGPNGAGKSTLLHTLAGLIRPETGTATIDGKDVHGMAEHERARVLAFLTQSQGSVPRLTVQDLISFGRWPHHRGRPKAEDHAAVDDALNRFDLMPLAARTVEDLSGGQKQRAFVAMAYAQGTPWIYLDEPLAALDPKYTRDIMDRLKDLKDRAILLVLHDLSIAANYADRVVGLKAGQLHCAGAWKDVVTSDLLSDLYDVPLKLTQIDGQSTVIWAK